MNSDYLDELERLLYEHGLLKARLMDLIDQIKYEEWRASITEKEKQIPKSVVNDEDLWLGLDLGYEISPEQ